MPILSPSMGAQLLKSGLFAPQEMESLLAHAANFPTLQLNRLFLEYQVKDGLSLEGYGHGYSFEQFDEVMAADPPRMAAPQAQALQAALSHDPFRAERGYYLERRSKDDPEWIEYDWSGTQFHDAPAVFFMVPTRLQSFASAERLANLACIFAQVSGDTPDVQATTNARQLDVVAFLGELRKRTPEFLHSDLAIYRLGLATSRAPGWMKLVLSGIDSDAIRSTLSAFGSECLDVFAPVVALYRHFGPPDQVPLIAASLDCAHGVIHAVDVECPYFNGLHDSSTRRAAVRTFVTTLVDRQILSQEAGQIIIDAAYREFSSDDQEALLTLNHFKFGIAGKTRGRLKLYFEVMTRDHRNSL